MPSPAWNSTSLLVIIGTSFTLRAYPHNMAAQRFVQAVPSGRLTMSASQPAAPQQRMPESLMLIHGFLDSHVGWDPLIAQWQAQATSIVAPDLRGAGSG